jgi:hypothetical protein
MTKMAEAQFILREAAAAGLKIGTDGTEVIMVAPLRMAWECRRSFERAIEAHQAEIIALIMAENSRHSS